MNKYKVLVVEDEAIIALHLKKLVLRLGEYECASVVSGEEAVEISKTMDPDLIFMDINLKGQINGIEAAQKICNEKNVPVVFISAYSDDETIEKAKRTNPAGYLTKPVSGTTVQRTLDSLLKDDPEEHFSANYEAQNVNKKEFGGILETPIMALPQFILRPEE